MKKILIIFISAACCLWSAVSFADDTPRNIILMIGDGMGAAQLTAGLVTKGELNIERMRIGGLVKTFAANNMVTDSAAAATAMATGHKTKRGMLSITPDGKPKKTLFEYAKDHGKATGVAVTCSITHATPAAFMAHVRSRSMNDEIAEQIADSKTDVLFGGGLGAFLPKGRDDSTRKDKKDVLKRLSKQKMQIALNTKEFRALNDEQKAAGLLASEHPEPSDKRDISLGEMVSKAIKILNNNGKGFVLLVEGSQVDWAGHANDIIGIEREVAEFDEAVGMVLDFAEKDENTLVVVTADHETGGLIIQGGSVAEKKLSEAAWTSNKHTGVMVPIFAMGPGAEAFGGIKDNTDIGKLLIKYVEQ